MPFIFVFGKAVKRYSLEFIQIIIAFFNTHISFVHVHFQMYHDCCEVEVPAGFIDKCKYDAKWKLCTVGLELHCGFCNPESHKAASIIFWLDGWL